MSFEEEKNNDLQSSNEQYTGCDEELSQEITDEEYEQMMGEDVEPEQNGNTILDMIADFKDQAVCKILFLIAVVGFIFPFFTEYDSNMPLMFTTGLDTFKEYTMVSGTIPVAKSWILMGACVLAALGFVLSVTLKRKLRNIFGFICSLGSTVCMGVFAYMLPTQLQESLGKFLENISAELSQMYGITIPDFETLAMYTGIDLSGFSVSVSSGFYFVLTILVVLVVYFGVQIAIDSKNSTKVDVTLVEGEFPEDMYEEELAEETSEEEVEELTENEDNQQ